MSRFPPWHFRVMEPGEVHVDPVHDEFFKAQDVADALVRESIQNSLDARDSRRRGPVRVRFRFASGSEALHPDAVREYFTGLEDHLQATAKTIHGTLPREGEAVPYLLIEDFGTRGLTGEPETDPELEGDGEGRRNDFFYFWRNVGRSNKSANDRGRWGLGKAVFTVASRIRTIFGITRRADDQRSLLLGQAVLKTHILDAERIDPYGFFARFEKKSGLPLPIEDRMLLDRFADDFRVDRREPGLSIVVPFYRDDELTPARVTASVVQQYFYPILRGDLVAEVVEGTHTLSIAADTIDSLAGGDTNLTRLCALTRWSLQMDEASRIVLPEPGAGAPKWHDEVLDAARIDELRDRFAAGERLAFRVPVFVKRKQSRARMSWFDVCLESDETLRKSDHHFIRRGITIPDVKANADRSARALIVIDDQALATFLGDAENPAHSDWSERADKVRTLYEHGPWTLRFVKNAAAFLTALLSRPPEGRVRDFLADLFFIDAPDVTAAEPVAGRLPLRTAAGESGKEPGAEGSGGGSGISIAKVSGGFVIKAFDPRMVGRTLRGEVAYRVRTGNPFRKHSPFDFDLTDAEALTVQTDGARLTARSINTFDLVPTSPKFQIAMKGFDARRDLVVRLADSDNATETELH